MVKVSSSSGGKVNIQILGVRQAAAFIRKKGKDIKDGADEEVFQEALKLIDVHCLAASA